jgi:hypothetical protein
MTSNLVEFHWRFKGTYYFHLQGWRMGIGFIYHLQVVTTNNSTLSLFQLVVCTSRSLATASNTEDSSASRVHVLSSQTPRREITWSPCLPHNSSARTEYKTPYSTIPPLLRVDSLLRERVYGAVWGLYARTNFNELDFMARHIPKGSKSSWNLVSLLRFEVTVGTSTMLTEHKQRLYADPERHAHASTNFAINRYHWYINTDAHQYTRSELSSTTKDCKSRRCKDNRGGGERLATVTDFSAREHSPSWEAD